MLQFCFVASSIPRSSPCPHPAQAELSPAQGRPLQAANPGVPVLSLTDASCDFFFREHFTTASHVPGDVCLHPPSPGRRGPSPPWNGGPRDFQKPHNPYAAPAGSTWSWVSPTRPRLQTRLGGLGSVTPLHILEAQDSIQGLQVAGRSVLQGISLQASSRIEKLVSQASQLPLPQHAGAAILQFMGLKKLQKRKAGHCKLPGWPAPNTSGAQSSLQAPSSDSWLWSGAATRTSCC